MNFRRNLFGIIALASTVCLVAGCGKDKSFKRYTFIEEVEDKGITISYYDDSYIKYGSYSSFMARNQSSDVELGLQDEIMRNNANKKLMNTTGDQKLLVVPVKFKDYGCADLGISEETYISDLNKAFFGVSQNNSYVSVSQYFNLSSYGKFRLGGEVVNDFFTINKTIKDIKTKEEKSSIKSLYKDVLEFCETQGVNLDDYVIEGLEGDKNIPIYLVYTYPADLSVEYFWAFTFSDVPMSWSSHSFMYTQYGEPDAHTYIHETGHLLGLNDYYPTEEKAGVTSPDPTGRIDMMDCSIGDETAFSKMYLNWTRPYHVLKSCEITLRSFTETGDLILINNSWNKTVFDEYYLIEFYTPTGLNNYDAKIGNSNAKLPSLPGIKVYHVDARLAYFTNIDSRQGDPIFAAYCTEDGYSPTKNNIGFAHNNCTYSATEIASSKNLGNYLYELKLNNSEGMISGCAENANLYHSGDVIAGLKTNVNKQPIPYKITVESMNFNEAKLIIKSTSN